MKGTKQRSQVLPGSLWGALVLIGTCWPVVPLVSTPEPSAAPEVPKPGKAGIVWVYSKPAGVELTKAEITVAQFRQCTDAGACKVDNKYTKSDSEYCNWGHPDRDNHPINCAIWYGAEEFCKWAGGRLPTEDEWYAEASSNGKREYPWGAERVTCEHAVWGDGIGTDGCGRNSTWPVCSKPRGNSASGLCDMSGNVWEWTSSSEGGLRAVRGGSWAYGAPGGAAASVRVLREPDD